MAAVAGAMTVPAGTVAQEPFRVTYNVERQDAGKTTMTGTVQNEARGDVIDVYVTAEALDANKKVIARGISFVTSSLRQGATAPFTVSIPAPPTANAFRVRVSSYRMGLAIQGP
jgi:hypothetical protein